MDFPMNFIMHIIYTRVNTIYGYNWYVLFCYLLTASAYAQLAVRARAARPTSNARLLIFSLYAVNDKISQSRVSRRLAASAG